MERGHCGFDVSHFIRLKYKKVAALSREAVGVIALKCYRAREDAAAGPDHHHAGAAVCPSEGR